MSNTVIHAPDLDEDPFQRDPMYSTSFSKCVREGSDVELSGADAYNGLALPLIKALGHLSNAEAPPKTAWYLDTHLLPFAKRFAERVLRHPTELATGKAFVPKMKVDGSRPRNVRPTPRETIR